MASEGSDKHKKASAIRGHHLYKSIWTMVIREELHVLLKAEDWNEHDNHAVAVMKNGCVRQGGTPSARTQSIFETRCAIAIELTLPLAQKQGRSLFEGGFHSRQYCT